MVNSVGINPIFIDTVDTPGQPGVWPKKIQIIGFLINPSSDPWHVHILDEEGGNVILHSNRGGTNTQFFPIRVDAKGLWINTLTNITDVLIYRNATV